MLMYGNETKHINTDLPLETRQSSNRRAMCKTSEQHKRARKLPSTRRRSMRGGKREEMLSRQFLRALTLLFLRKNRGLLVVYSLSSNTFLSKLVFYEHCY